MRHATLLLLAAALFALPAQAQVLNEIMVSTTGTDTEFFEIGGTPGTDLTGLTLIVIEGDASSSTGVGIIDRAIALTGSIPADGYWVAASPETETAFGITPDQQFPDNSFENGTETIFLVTGFSGAEGDDVDTNDDGTLDVTPWSSIVDGISLVDGGINDSDRAYSDTVFGPDGDFLPPGVYRSPDLTGGPVILEFSPKPAPSATPGTANSTSTPVDPDAASLRLGLEVAPNPLTGTGTVFVHVSEAGPVLVEAYDLIGRRVAVLFDGVAVPGTPVEARFDVSELPAGTYLVRAAGAGVQNVRTVSVVR